MTSAAALEKAAREMRRARRTGRGVRIEEWRVTADESLSAGDLVLEWCREVISSCRRPFGIDHFDLAVACRSEDTRDITSERFLRLRPLDFYTEALAVKLTALLHGSRGTPSGLIVAAAMFSWGEAADKALPAHS